MRVVLDTNVVLSALLWDGASHVLLSRAREQSVEIMTSETLLSELRRILVRRKFAPKIRGSGLTVDQLVQMYAGMSMVVQPVDIPKTATDPDDDMVLGTALAGGADLIVSGDAHLLVIKEFRGIPILTVQEATRRL